LVAPDFTPDADLEVNGTMVFLPRTNAPNALAGQQLEGTVYYSSPDKILKYHNGTDWKPFGGASLDALSEQTIESTPVFKSTPNVTTSASCPANHVVTGVRIYSHNQCPSDCRFKAGWDGYDTGRITHIAVICQPLQ